VLTRFIFQYGAQDDGPDGVGQTKSSGHNCQISQIQKLRKVCGFFLHRTSNNDVAVLQHLILLVWEFKIVSRSK
jgi:hypothetical protein